jgi:hypothetical protein
MTKSIKTTFATFGMAFTVSVGATACAGDTSERVSKMPAIEIVQVAHAQQVSAPAEKTQPVTKRVCIDRITKDGKPVLGKDGKPLQDCREMKIHKKLEGTVVPQK